MWRSRVVLLPMAPNAIARTRREMMRTVATGSNWSLESNLRFDSFAWRQRLLSAGGRRASAISRPSSRPKLSEQDAGHNALALRQTPHQSRGLQCWSLSLPAPASCLQQQQQQQVSLERFGEKRAILGPEVGSAECETKGVAANIASTWRYST